MQKQAGIDIGAKSIHLAYTCPPDPRTGSPFAVQEIDLSTDWPGALKLFLGPDPSGVPVALEATGTHYSAPIVTYLHHLGCVVFAVDHATSKRFRQAHLSLQKTDTLDATALCMIASAFSNGEAIRGVRLINPLAERLTTTLRATINHYDRLTKEQTQAKNRCRQLVHDIWPGLSQNFGTYTRAVSAGAVTPAELRRLVAAFDADEILPAYEDGRARPHLRRLVRSMPDWVEMPPFYRPIVAGEFRHLAAVEPKTAEAEASIAALIEGPDLIQLTELLRTIPGNFDYAIATLHAATRCDLERYSRDRLRGAIGFYPQRRASGGTVSTKQPMSGYKPARRALHLWAMRLCKEENRPNPVAAYYDMKKAAGHKYAFPAARGKLTRIIAGIAQSGQPCNWNLKEEPTHEAPIENDPRPESQDRQLSLLAAR